MAEERGLSVDVDGFNHAMDEARERSRSAQTKVRDYSFVGSLEFTRYLVILYPQNHKLHFYVHTEILLVPYSCQLYPFLFWYPSNQAGPLWWMRMQLHHCIRERLQQLMIASNLLGPRLVMLILFFIVFFTHPWIKWTTIWWNKLAARKSPSSRNRNCLKWSNSYHHSHY